MRVPPYKCLFCLEQEVPFTRVEHPIPESLGNDDWVYRRASFVTVVISISAQKLRAVSLTRL